MNSSQHSIGWNSIK